MTTMQDFHQQMIAQPAEQGNSYQEALQQVSQMELKDIKQIEPDPWPEW